MRNVSRFLRGVRGWRSVRRRKEEDVAEGRPWEERAEGAGAAGAGRNGPGGGGGYRAGQRVWGVHAGNVGI